MADATLTLDAEINTSDWNAGVKDIESGGRQIEDSARQADDALGDVDKSASKSSSGLGKFGAAAGAVGGLVSSGIGMAVDAIADLTGDIVEASDSADKFKSTLNFAGLDTSTIDALTASTQEYADQTVYSISDIRNVTAQLAANGVQGFDKLAEAAGNLNAVAGGSADTFSSVGMVLTQTAGAGRLTTENWNQLADAIPGASGKLQEAMLKNGAYTGNFRDALEKGEISAEEFNQAIMDLGMTDAAKEFATSTDTLDGAMGNLEASVVRVGQTILDQFKQPLTDGISSVAQGISGLSGVFTGLVQTIGPILSQIGTTFQTAFVPIVQQVIGALKGVGDSFTASFSSSGGTLSGLLGIASTIVSLMSPLEAARLLFEQFGGQIQQIASTIGPQLVNVLNNVAAVLGGAIGGLLPGIQSAISAFLPVIGQIITTVGQIAATVMPVISSLASQLVPVITQIAQVVSQLMATLAPIIANLVSTLLPVIQNIVSALMELAQAVMPIVMQVISTVMSLIQMLMPVIQTIATVISSVAGVIVTVIGQIISLVTNVVAVVVSAVSLVTGVISNIISVVSSVFGTILSVISSVVSGVVSAVTGAFNTVVNVISSAVSSVVAFITGLASSISRTFSGIASTVGNAINGAANALRAGFSGMVSAAGSFVGNIMSTIGGIPGRIQSAFSGAANWLVSAGRNIIQGLINGITDAIGGAISAVKDAVGGIIDGAKSLLGIHSPSRVFDREIGRMIPAGLGRGVTENERAATRPVEDMVNSLLPSSIVTPMPVVSSPVPMNANNGPRVNAPITVNALDPNAAAQETVRVINFHYV